MLLWTSCPSFVVVAFRVKAVDACSYRRYFVVLSSRLIQHISDSLKRTGCCLLGEMLRVKEWKSWKSKVSRVTDLCITWYYSRVFV